MPRNPPRRDGGGYKPPGSRFRPRDGQSRNGDGWRPDNSYSDRRDRGGPRSRGNGNRPPPSNRFNVPQGDFTFRMDKPAGMGESSPGGRGHHAGDGRRDQRRPQRGRGGRRWQPPLPAERALISGATLNLPEERLDGLSGSNKFRDLDELSDDDELAMDISSHSEDEEGQEPSTKRQRTGAAAESAAQAPKWSNPDPYTALPCPEDTTHKRRDVVKLIRKARLEEKGKLAAPSQAEDFLSFDPTEDEDETSEESDSDSESEPDYEPPPPALPSDQAPTKVTLSHALPQRPPMPEISSSASTSNPLGSRKRTIDDEIKPPNYGSFKKGGVRPAKGSIATSWLTKKGENPCPWATVDHSATTDMAFRLHKEVMDFYEYVRPRDFEQRIRDNLVDNLKQAMRRDGRNFASAHVFPFGSFMSGLYLPTADMDIVVCSASFMRGGPPTYLGAKSWLYKFQKFLVSQRVADSDAVQVIAHARIPLVKFVDKITGLRVDISFENLGGVDAIETFVKWKQLYPCMPILVTVIKHYLLMRGLNEPVNGGIGGFSVICLVVSMLQLLPQVQSRSLVPEHHLGEMLLEFFDLYGHQFDYEVNAISLTAPAGYVKKSNVRSFTYKSTDRLSIIDPNNSENDISGGSSNAATIFERFGDTFVALRKRMDEVANDQSCGGILDVIMKGDYSSFHMQRAFLKKVHEKFIGPCSN
ncbi:PAP/25A-associated-like protein [Cordyceps fumosorosea ARSEF 2679]|uniref:polynucleotide adenylyltransferase n=1 Tax=Cordyceps fumosorosea (strain ARSEF 2679) TaxID=1081104 RepID=A0A162JLH6_CORFA|nr:PAP/25A-associated-like protein [Cordyceps fumosorosea ARSEF 2679]OAA70702.1 PAP/25A-associated-like protein [Cordyceps fumosorosea ARSEF 2679]